MIRSMTGFGSAAGLCAGRAAAVEVRSVNNRFRETAVKLPRACAGLEERLKKLVAARLARGRVDLWARLDDREARPQALKVDFEAARRAAEALEELRARLNLGGGATLDHLLALGLFSHEEPPLDLEEAAADLETLAGRALDALTAMREAEGLNLGLDLRRRLAALSEMTRRAGVLAAGVPAALAAKLRGRLAELTPDIDPGRLAQEAALLADRADVSEELTRLDSHLGRFARLMEDPEAVGRRLDFLLQEMGREVNTLGSKAQDLELIGLTLDMKAELEKLREQVQNIE